MSIESDIRNRMRELGLNRDTPFSERPAPDFHQELEQKIKSGMGVGTTQPAAAEPIEKIYNGGYSYSG